MKREKGKIDVLFASAGVGEPVPLGEITEQHFDKTFDLNVRGTLFTVQKALPLFNEGGSIFMTGSNAAAKGFPGFSVYAASKLALRILRTHLAQRAEGQKDPREPAGSRCDCHNECRKQFSPRKRSSISNP